MICTDAENHVTTVCEHPDPRHASKCEHGHGQIPRVTSYCRRWITVFSYRESNTSKSTSLKSRAPKIHPSIAPAFPLLAHNFCTCPSDRWPGQRWISRRPVMESNGEMLPLRLLAQLDAVCGSEMFGLRQTYLIASNFIPTDWKLECHFGRNNGEQNVTVVTPRHWWTCILYHFVRYLQGFVQIECLPIYR